jgi:hypothetical protein
MALNDRHHIWLLENYDPSITRGSGACQEPGAGFERRLLIAGRTTTIAAPRRRMGIEYESKSGRRARINRRNIAYTLPTYYPFVILAACSFGGVAELADAHDLGSCSARSGGSSPPFPTRQHPLRDFFRFPHSARPAHWACPGDGVSAGCYAASHAYAAAGDGGSRDTHRVTDSIAY